jgi:hypothetical protein
LYLPIVANAYFTKAQRKELDHKIFKTEQHLKKVMTRDLELSVGVKEILVDVKIDVNKYKVYKEVSSMDESWAKIEKLQLPSLFIDKDQQRDLIEVKNIEIEHILSHIKSIDLKLSSPYDIVDKDGMNENLKSVLASNYSKANKVKLNITYSKTKELLVDNRKKSLSTPKYMNVINDFKKLRPYVLGIIGALLLGLLIFLALFKRSMSKMVSAIDDIEFSGNITAKLSNQKQDNLPALSSHENRQLASGSGGNISSYIELLEKIKFLVKKNKNLLFEMINLHFKLGEVAKILVLLNIVDNKERESLYKKIPANHLKDLQDFVINEGELLYKDEEKLNNIAQEIFRVISIAMVKPGSFYQIYLKKIIVSLSASEIANVIRSCTQRELMYFMENVDGVKLAFVCATNDFSNIEFGDEKVELNTEEVKKFVQKLAKFIYVKSSTLEGNANAKIIPHLSSEMEEKYIESMGISRELSFNNLVIENSEYTENSIKERSFEDIHDFLVLFDQEQQDHFISILPELVGERLKSRHFEFSENTFRLKIQLYSELKVEHQKITKAKIEEASNHLEYIDEEFKKIDGPQDAAVTPEISIVSDSTMDKSDDDDVA